MPTPVLLAIPMMAAVLILVTTSVAPAVADVTSADERPSQAFGPLQLGRPYAGSFASGGDVDFLSFSVTSPGQALSFTVQNTTANCADPNDAGCPVYATLVDGSVTQLGGDTSAAGTIATAGDTETFTWSFSQPGTYYILLESNGDLPPGSPTYDATVGPVSPNGGSGGTGGGSAGGSGAGAGSGSPPPPVLRSLLLPPRQRGRGVVVRVVLGQRIARLVAALTLSSRGRPIRTRTLAAPGMGPHRLVLRLPYRYLLRLRRAHRLSMFVRINLVTEAGSRQYYTRGVTLSR